MQRANIYNTPYEYDDSDPDPYRAGMKHLTRALNASELAVKAFEIPPGQSLCPYHYEYVEEWLIVLEGAVTVRTPDGEHPLHKGDVTSFSAGPEGAHKLTNNENTTAQIIMFSSAREPAVAVYPDSDKILAITGNPNDRVMLRRKDGQVDYYDGET